MKIFVVGNMGYIGPVVVSHLRTRYPGAELVGYDSGLFEHCVTARGKKPDADLSHQIIADVRDLPAEVLRGADTVVHLAAVSNDPMGSRFAAPTDAINFRATVDVARKAHAVGVRTFVFASSCSVYGFSEGGPRRESDRVDPLTAYARSKIAAEQALEACDLTGMTVTCLRFATACGMSPRLRLDLVLNDFVASALATGRIEVLSDGKPWRPLIDVRDMARAIEWAATRDADHGGRLLRINVGSESWNFQVEALAAAVAAEIDGAGYSINPLAQPDRRSYRVGFSLYRALAPEHQPRIDLQQSIRGLRDGLDAIGFRDADFRNSDLIRLKVLERHVTAQRLDPDLRWSHAPATTVPARMSA